MAVERVVVNGAGVAGLSTAIFLARSGCDVVLLERDHSPLPESPDEAFEWQRRGAPQVRHSHALLARLRNLLRDHLPDVHQELLAAGATEVAWQDMAPPTLTDRAPRPGDEDLVLLACRRTTFEWVLRRAALGTDRVELRDGASVVGLVAEPGTEDRPPRVTGVRTAEGVVIEAGLVVEAGGRRSALPRFLADLGVGLTEDEQDTGIIYLSRFYRLRPGVEPPDKQALNGGDLGYLKFAVFRGDNRSFSVTLAVGTDDTAMRALSDPDRFEAAIALLPAVAPWVDPAVSEPITDVHVMAGLINRKRHFVVDGRPVALGLVAVGDASVCTNPLYGRGCALGAVHGRLLADAVAAHGDDLGALALAFDEATERELVPWYTAAVNQDETAKKVLRGEELSPEVQMMHSILTEGLIPLARIDPDVNRVWVRSFSLLDPPAALMADQELMAKVLAHWQERESRAPEPPPGPPRDELMAALEEVAA
jgi:2-polyprenyl-6-methoxyphenol hydroxylase-like FAD-dependent oxidoreductase